MNRFAFLRFSNQIRGDSDPINNTECQRSRKEADYNTSIPLKVIGFCLLTRRERAQHYHIAFTQDGSL